MLPGVCEPSGSASISVAVRNTGLPDPHVAQTVVGKPAPPSLDLETDLLKRAFQIFRALVFLHARLGEIVEHVADNSDRLGIAVDRLERDPLESLGESANAEGKIETSAKPSINKAKTLARLR